MIFESDRVFSVFSYTMSHGLLLLRSGKTAVSPTRVDILFQDVRAMEMRFWFEGLTIQEEADPAFLRGFCSNPSSMIEHGNKIYSIKGREWQGFVVGGVVSFREDGGELFAPSGLLEESGA